MNEKRVPLTEADKQGLRERLAWFRKWQEWLGSMPDQEPVMRRTIRSKGASNLMSLRKRPVAGYWALDAARSLHKGRPAILPLSLFEAFGLERRPLHRQYARS